MAENKDPKAEPSKNSGGTKLLLWVLIAIILVSGTMIATLVMTGNLNKLLSDNTATAATAISEAQAQKAPALYLTLDPPFVVNFDEDGILRYLQVSVAVMSRDKIINDAVFDNMPRIRNDLIMLFGNQDFVALKTSEGKEQLRQEVLTTIHAVLQDEIGQAGVENVYFTTFVMQ